MDSLSEEIRQQAFSLGWDDIGVTAATIPECDMEAYKKWLTSNQHADLQYMENQIRCQPELLLPGAKSAILFVSYYKKEKLQFETGKGLIASYARSRDYHHIHRGRLKKFITWLEDRVQQKNIAKGFSDSTPLLEKALAVQAGLGWFGKNTLLIHRKFGTFILLSGVLTTLELPHTILSTRQARCGSCQRCLDACPTQAFVSPYTLDAAKCLSYHLIESKKEIPQEIAKKNPGYIFGCDICQDVCPHNARKKPSDNIDFSIENEIGAYLTLEGLERVRQSPEKLFGTPLQRRKVEGLIRSALSLGD